MYITYTPTRQIAGGAGELSGDLSVYDRDQKTDATASVSLSGKQQTTFNRVDVFYQVSSVPVERTEWAKWREFGASVAAGELFTFDALGTKAVPDNPVNVRADLNSFKETRNGNNYITFSFKCREV